MCFEGDDGSTMLPTPSRDRVPLQWPVRLCDILIETDSETSYGITLRKLFVGATRATMKLTLVLWERAAKLLLVRLDASGTSASL